MEVDNAQEAPQDTSAFDLADKMAKIRAARRPPGEFEARVSAAVEERTAALGAQVEALKALVERAMTAQAPAPQANGQDLKAIFENLGMTFADIATQGIGVQKPVAPEVLRAREEAHKRMISLIKQAKAHGIKPRYRILAECFLEYPEPYGSGRILPFWVDADHVRQPTDIDFPGIPNLAMKPLNEAAEQIHAAYKESIGNMGKLTVAEELAGINAGVKVYGGPERKVRRDAPGAFDVAAGADGVRVLHQGGRGQTRQVNVLGTVAAPAEISG